MFKVRLRSSIILLAITVAVILLGGNVLFGALVVISLIGLNELYKAVGIGRALPGLLGYGACIAYYVLLYFRPEEYQLPLFLCFLLLLMTVYVFTFPKYTTEQITVAYFGLFYVAILLSFIYQVRSLEGGVWLVWLIFIGAWGSDTCAYCVGMLFGKHKLTPKLSPKKSVEGSAGGIVGAALIGLIYGSIFKDNITGIGNPQLAFTVIGAASGAISQIGDLAASAIKRNHNIKDYGKLIPGHGGILDRFDSVIFTAPVVYYLAVLLG